MANVNFSSSTGKGFYKNAGGVSASIDTEALLKTLKELPINILRNVMVGAVRAGANVIRDEARRLVDKDTHTLEKSIISIQRSGKKGKGFSMLDSNPNNITFSVTPSKGGKYDGWYGHFKEFGTSKMNASPFLRPAFESQADNVLQTTKQYIANRLPQEVEKAKR